jgi:UDP-N-acetylglucosamine 1-carboxyvinyltransferase
MAAFEITGGRRLQGELTPQGAKNEALQVICATLLTPETVIIRNIPEILDVQNLIKLLAEIGVETHQLEPATWSFRASDLDIN